jgi:hypothetical protein
VITHTDYFVTIPRRAIIDVVYDDDNKSDKDIGHDYEAEDTIVVSYGSRYFDSKII